MNRVLSVLEVFSIFIGHLGFINSCTLIRVNKATIWRLVLFSHKQCIKMVA